MELQAFFADLQHQFDALGGGQHSIILNGVDDVDTAKHFNPTGALRPLWHPDASPFE